MKKNKEFYSVAELAKKMKISRIAVHKRIKKGQLKASKIGKNYAIPGEAVDYLLAEQREEIPLKYGSIILYSEKEKGSKIEVKLEKNNIWMDQKQISRQFGTERSVITKHIGNIFDTGELSRKSNVQKMHIPLSDKPVKYYNLDVIISVGYRVNSKKATQFRIWATKVLKDHIIKGYTVNEKRLAELQKVISLVAGKAKEPLLKGQPEELLSIIDEYSKSLKMLHDYDEGKLKPASGPVPEFVLEYSACIDIIKGAKEKLILRKEAGDNFGREQSGKFKGLLGAVYQTFGGEDLYRSIEEKAAHLLYFTIKDHPFVDGNKRIGSILFIEFLYRNRYLFRKNGEKKINDNALTALALLVALSAPGEKEVMIKIIMNLIM